MSSHDPHENLPPHVTVDGVRLTRDGDVYEFGGLLFVERMGGAWEGAFITDLVEQDTFRCDTPTAAAAELTKMVTNMRLALNRLRRHAEEPST